jgi:hypothetical protein
MLRRFGKRYELKGCRPTILVIKSLDVVGKRPGAIGDPKSIQTQGLCFDVPPSAEESEVKSEKGSIHGHGAVVPIASLQDLPGWTKGYFR